MRFNEPYDQYLLYLLNLSGDLVTFDPLHVDPKTTKISTGQSRWTVWVSREIRDRFNVRKNVLAPNKTHGQFVELLLAFKESLVEKNFNVPFQPHVREGWHSPLSPASPQMSRLSVDVRFGDGFSSGFPSPDILDATAGLDISSHSHSWDPIDRLFDDDGRSSASYTSFPPVQASLPADSSFQFHRAAPASIGFSRGPNLSPLATSLPQFQHRKLAYLTQPHSPVAKSPLASHYSQSQLGMYPNSMEPFFAAPRTDMRYSDISNQEYGENGWSQHALNNPEYALDGYHGQENTDYAETSHAQSTNDWTNESYYPAIPTESSSLPNQGYMQAHTFVNSTFFDPKVSAHQSLLIPQARRAQVGFAAKDGMHSQSVLGEVIGQQNAA